MKSSLTKLLASLMLVCFAFCPLALAASDDDSTSTDMEEITDIWIVHENGEISITPEATEWFTYAYIAGRTRVFDCRILDQFGERDISHCMLLIAEVIKKAGEYSAGEIR